MQKIILLQLTTSPGKTGKFFQPNLLSFINDKNPTIVLKKKCKC